VGICAIIFAGSLKKSIEKRGTFSFLALCPVLPETNFQVAGEGAAFGRKANFRNKDYSDIAHET